MCDKLVFDLSQEVEGSPNVFIRKDWINILDNMNQNYQNNQSIIDTSQLANSNKYMSYREAYLAMPLTATVIGPTYTQSGNVAGIVPYDYSLGLKNWFGTMIHSFTLDYNGTTIIQQTPFINMWNIFKLLTSLSYQDVMTMGPTIGFYPDTSDSFTYSSVSGYAAVTQTSGSQVGLGGICNNEMAVSLSTTSVLSTQSYDQKFLPSNAQIPAGGNVGLTYRTKWIAYRPSATLGSSLVNGVTTAVQYNTICESGNLPQIWKSNISSSFATAAAGDAGKACYKQYSIMAIIYLRHIHSFFNMCPLLKGVFMKMTMNLNNASTTIDVSNDGLAELSVFTGYTSQIPVGGTMPIIVPSMACIPGGVGIGQPTYEGSGWLQQITGATTAVKAYYNISVGATCLNSTMQSLLPAGVAGNLSKSVYLYVPAYTFNPPFEEAYLSNSVKQIKYTDVYQYQYQTSVQPGQPFNFLVTNGIANIKSVLIIPFLKQAYTSATQTTPQDYLQYQSPFDTAGGGTTAPMVTLGNFNVQISGQNAIYNTQRYTYEEFVNQLYGQNAVNGGMTDGINSGLINFHDFQMAYSYYYVNVERMLPVEQSVPKSVQVLGTNFTGPTQTGIPIQFWIFIEYGVEIKIDVLTGARV